MFIPFIYVRYLYRDEEIAPTTRTQFDIGVKYEILAPEIEGYIPDRRRIKGKAGINDVTHVITYNKKSNA